MVKHPFSVGLKDAAKIEWSDLYAKETFLRVEKPTYGCQVILLHGYSLTNWTTMTRSA